MSSVFKPYLFSQSVFKDLNTAGIMTEPMFSWDFTRGSLPKETTFTRASSASYFDKTGVLQTASTNQPRFDYDPVTLIPKGLLIEPAATNIGWPSVPTANLSNNGTTQTIAGAPASLDGVSPMTKIMENNALAQHFSTLLGASSVTLGTTYVASAVFKQAERTTGQITFPFATFGVTAFANFDLATGVVSATGASVTSSGIRSMGNGRYLCFVAAPAILTAAAGVIFSAALTSSRLPVYQGVTGNGLYVSNIQLEEGSFPTSRINTTVVAVTRAADTYTISPVGTLGFNATSGTFMVKGSYQGLLTVDGQRLVELSNGTSNERMGIGILSDGSLGGYVVSGGVASSTPAAIVGPASFTNYSIALAYEINNSAISGNGSSPVTDTTVTIPSINRFTLGGAGSFSASSQLNGWFNQISYFSERLTNTTLKSLTGV